MKAQAFLELVGKMIAAQQDYFAARRKGVGVITERDLLIKSKDLEKQVMGVVKVGSLDPDELQPTVYIHTTEEYQRQLDFTDHQRPTDGQGEQPT